MTVEVASLDRILDTMSGIEPGYRHAPKQVTPGEPPAAHAWLFDRFAGAA